MLVSYDYHQINLSSQFSTAFLSVTSGIADRSADIILYSVPVKNAKYFPHKFMTDSSLTNYDRRILFSSAIFVPGSISLCLISISDDFSLISAPSCSCLYFLMCPVSNDYYMSSLLMCFPDNIVDFFYENAGRVYKFYAASFCFLIKIPRFSVGSYDDSVSCFSICQRIDYSHPKRLESGYNSAVVNEMTAAQKSALSFFLFCFGERKIDRSVNTKAKT